MRTNLQISAIAIAAALLVALPTYAATINIGGAGNGGLVNVTGTNGTDPHVDALTSTGAPTGTANTNALNNGNDPTTADINLGGNGGSSGNVLLDLFGDGGGNDANVTLGTEGGSPAGGNQAAVDLFGNGTGADGSGGTGGGTGTGGINGGSTDDLFGPANGSGGIKVASLNGNVKCFTPNATQLAKLTGRHTYGPATFSAWAEMSSVKIVDVGLCNGVGTDISSDPNIAKLQAFVSGSAVIRANLAKAGRSPGDVIAVDKSGSTVNAARGL